MTIYDRIKKMRLKKEISQETLAKLVGYTNRTSIAKIESGSVDISQSKIEAFAKALDTTPAYLMGWEEESPDNILPIRFKKIPLLGEIAAGEPIFADQEYGAYVTAGEDLNADFALRVKGDSMSPRIQNGDVVFIAQQPTVENGQIAAIIIEDEATLKRVYINEDTITLISENAAYAPFSYKIGEENIRILGRAVAFTRKV